MIPKEVSTTTLAPGGFFTSSWIDNGGSQSEVMAVVTCYSDQAGTFGIVQSPDKENYLMTLPSLAEGQVQMPGRTCFLNLPITQLYWQVWFQNGTTQQNQFEIVIAASVNMEIAILLELQKLNFSNRENRGSSNSRDELLGYPIGR